MPFDHPDRVNYKHSAISTLIQEADEALNACEREACVEIIQHIYDLLDQSSCARVVSLVGSADRRPAPGHAQRRPKARARRLAHG